HALSREAGCRANNLTSSCRRTGWHRAGTRIQRCIRSDGHSPTGRHASNARPMAITSDGRLKFGCRRSLGMDDQVRVFIRARPCAAPIPSSPPSTESGKSVPAAFPRGEKLMAREKVTLAYSGAPDTSVLFEFTNALHQGVYPLNATLSR